VADKKYTKQEVNYSKGMKTRRCFLCEHFDPPRSCEIVEGDIRPDFWCEKFKKLSQ